jgi:hypothetical protein
MIIVILCTESVMQATVTHAWNLDTQMCACAHVPAHSDMQAARTACLTYALTRKWHAQLTHCNASGFTMHASVINEFPMHATEVKNVE